MKLDDWLICQTDGSPDAASVALRHITVEEKSDIVQQWPLIKNVEGLASDIWTVAQNWTNQLGSGPQRFSVLLMDDKGKVLCQHIFRVGTDVVGGLAYDSEPATMAGVTKQLMRHTEALMKGSAQGYAQIVDHLTTQLDRAYARIEALEKRHVDLVAVSEELINAKTERDLLLARENANQQRKDAIVKKIGLLLPVAVAKMSGRPLQGSVNPSMLEFARSIDREQLDKLAAVLRPEQQIALASVLEMVTPEDESTANDSATNGKTAYAGN